MSQPCADPSGTPPALPQPIGTFPGVGLMPRVSHGDSGRENAPGAE